MKNHNMLEDASLFLKTKSKHAKEYSYSYKNKSDKMLMFERIHNKEYKEWLSLVNLKNINLPKNKSYTFFYFANYINDNTDVFIKFIIDNKLNKSDYLKYYKDRIKYIYSELAKKEVNSIKEKYKDKYKQRVDYIHNEYKDAVRLGRKAMHEFLVREWPKKEKKRDGEIALTIYKYKDIIDYSIYRLRNTVNKLQGKSKLEVIPKYESKKNWEESLRNYREKLMEVYTGEKDPKLTKEYRELNALQKRNKRLEKAKNNVLDTSNESVEKQIKLSNKHKKSYKNFIDKSLDKLKKKKGI